MDRRRFLATIAATGVTAFTGCSGDSDTTATTDQTQEYGNRVGTPSTTPTLTRKSQSTPESFPIHLNGVSAHTWPNESEKEILSREFTQSVGGRETEYQTKIPRTLFEYYTARSRTTSYGHYVSDRYDDQYVRGIADDLESFGERNDLSKPQVVNHAIAFTQGLEYTSDVNEPYNEYPKYPVETMVDRGGDCEDTSILLAALLEKLGYGAVLFLIPDAQHAAVGIRGDNSIDGLYYEYSGKRYYYVETTGSGWQVGEAPDMVKNSNGEADIREINSNPVLVFGFTIQVSGPGESQANFVFGNEGDARAENMVAQIEFEDKSGDIVSTTRKSLPRLDVGEKKEINFPVDTPPDDKPLLVRAGILLDRDLHDLVKTDHKSPP